MLTVQPSMYCLYCPLQDIMHFVMVVVICVVMTAMLVNIVFGVRVQTVASPGDAISRMFQCELLDTTNTPSYMPN